MLYIFIYKEKILSTTLCTYNIYIVGISGCGANEESRAYWINDKNILVEFYFKVIWVDFDRI